MHLGSRHTSGPAVISAVGAEYDANTCQSSITFHLKQTYSDKSGIWQALRRLQSL